MGNQHPLNEKKGGLRSPTIRKLAKDGTTWTPTEQVVRDKCLKQFCKSGRKGVEVSSGNSEAYKEGWDIIFGTPDQKAHAAEARALRQLGREDEICRDPGWPPPGWANGEPPPIPAAPASREPPSWTATITGIDP